MERIIVQTVWNHPEDIRMKYGIYNCAVLELERGRQIRTEGIEFPDGEMMKEVKGKSTLGYFN